MESFKMGFAFLLLLLGLALTSVQGTPVEDLAFEKFIDRAMRNYSDWLASKNLDPTPVIPDLVNLTGSGERFNSSGWIKNQRVYNHSVELKWFVKANVSYPDFFMFLTTPDYWAVGEYEVEGDIDGAPFKGAGQSNITAFTTLYDNPVVYISFQNFTTNAEGYLDLSSGINGTTYLTEHFGHFEGLNAGGNETFLSDELAKLYSKQDNDGWLPLDKYLKAYLVEALATTPYQDIIKP